MKKRFGWTVMFSFAVFLFFAVASVASAAEMIVDNTSAGSYTETGSWTTSGLAGYYGTNSRYAASGTANSKARWTPAVPSSGSYDVYIWYPANGNRATDAPYTVVYNGGSQTYLVDQTANGSQWIKLGTHSFAAGSSGYIELTNNANGYVSADAAALVTAGQSPPAGNPAVKATGLPVAMTPVYKTIQTLLDADPTGVDKYAAFPTLLKLSDTKVIVSYKRGDKHAGDSQANLETMIFNPTSKTVVSTATTDSTASVVNQNPELMRMPNGDIYNYVDQQAGGSTTRLGARVLKSVDNGDTFTDQGVFPQVGSYKYGYMFDDYNDGGTVYMLAMSFPELTGGTRAVHVLKTTDNGANWSYVKNLNSEFSFAFNESSLEKYGSGFLVIARGDNQVTKLFKTDANFNLIQQKDLSSAYSTIEYIGRPKLFVENGEYYLLSRNIQSGVNYLMLYRINPDTLELESSVQISQNSYVSSDSFYAEYYLQQDGGTTYFNIITYEKGSSSDYPNIVRYELKWDEVRTRLQQNFNAMTTGAAPSGWTVGTTGGTVTVEDVPSATDKSLKLSDSSASALVEATKTYAATTNNVTMTFNMSAAQADQVFGASLTGASAVNAVTIGWDSTGEIYTYNGASKTVLRTYSANTWYNVKIVARPASQKFDVYIDGTLAASNYTFRNAVSSISGVRINSTGANMGTAYFDDIIIY
ncbi:hypothetical protein [Paenibacillus thalictri]|uniref:Uncharacterized protein n=1 Tax=Paenibacillus thalictri TaxID=2527873 RepID=A0A4Q9DNS1_9BACL|nr:hypothetical protein [Paenibacillus thalictri]TBL75242.1 hypothetical protein EYB31_22760 [Paenibacillus thalictri]